jgi:CHAT domain-containing protein
MHRRTGAGLRRLVWDPVASYLNPVGTVFIVPDGSLQLLNFAALPGGGQSYLVETFTLQYLTSERDLVPLPRNTAGGGVLAIGAPSFDVTPPARAVSSAGPTPGFRSALLPCANFRQLTFQPLPASKRELEQLRALLTRSGSADARVAPVVTITGSAATEAAFKQQSAGKQLLHIATHGYFLDGSCSRSETDAFTAEVTVENPLLASGFALAGANQRYKGLPNEEDGILTAEEIATLDLTSVKWAVLSACDTGLGRLKAGEGVFGLRRAFQIAGVHTVIMSLWPVDDRTTESWMRDLYERRFVEGDTTPASVRNASLKALHRRRAKKLSTHPFYWAGFVAVGDWH